MASSSNTNNRREPIITFDSYYNCKRINGVLFPQPITTIRVMQHPSSPAQPEQPQSSISIHKRKRRNLVASTVQEIKKFSHNLLQCDEESSYILEREEVASGNKTYYILVPYEKFEEVNPIVENKYNLSMKERLDGKWTFEVRQRKETTKTEKIYYHERVDKTIRSFNDVATFVFYGMIYY
ncbi:hypothetical protein CDL12_26616 [Handroanthus impetiginosus]|uniref:Uncharacterized protein n=1 Tax=Handroanthus impetiginosus TaxID=429701 RepID=A0A2G9G7F2_9LAMI|nr:hypothetical protein CDL12_26616 [Handroanthus impetiginosus]